MLLSEFMGNFSRLSMEPRLSEDNMVGLAIVRENIKEIRRNLKIMYSSSCKAQISSSNLGQRAKS